MFTKNSRISEHCLEKIVFHLIFSHHHQQKHFFVKTKHFYLEIIRNNFFVNTFLLGPKYCLKIVYAPAWWLQGDNSKLEQLGCVLSPICSRVIDSLAPLHIITALCRYFYRLYVAFYLFKPWPKWSKVWKADIPGSCPADFPKN